MGLVENRRKSHNSYKRAILIFMINYEVRQYAAPPTYYQQRLCVGVCAHAAPPTYCQMHALLVATTLVHSIQ